MRRGGWHRGLMAAGAAAALVTTGLVAPLTASAEPPPSPPADAGAAPADDTRAPRADLVKSPRARLSDAEKREFGDEAPQLRRQRSSAPPAATGTPIGGTKPWLVLDDAEGVYAPEEFTLRAVGNNIEIWVQSDINFPDGDCRNDGVRNVITDDQVNAMVAEFDTNILPTESEAFSTAPARDGSAQTDVGFGGPLWELLGGGDPEFYVGDGDSTVVLVSNVRDANFYDPTTPEGSTFIAGFFSPLFNEAFDRNVMTIDSYDWLHRTGANPPDGGAGGLCSSEQPARPRNYESTFAHEYQHLLHYYTDPGETTWLNEGLSDYAQTLVGYSDTTIPYGRVGADSHITCYQGFYATKSFPYCGAENSITRWEDQPNEILADYGAAYALVTYLADRYGEDLITALHRDGSATGLTSLQNWLTANADKTSSGDVLEDFVAQMALDRLLDSGAKGLTDAEKARFTSARLSSAIRWDWAGSASSPGAPTNGADFVLAATDRPFDYGVTFAGAKTYPVKPLEWQVSSGELWSGEGDDVDRSAVVEASVPAGGGALTFESRTEIETGWDFGIVQVSTDGGETWTTVPGDATTSEHASGADGTIVGLLPGLTGTADWATRTYDLAAYAGKDVLISFRYLTDAATNGNGAEPTGWWVRDAAVGGTEIDLGTARSATQVRPDPVQGWSLQLVGWDGTKRVGHLEVPVGADGRAEVSAAKVRREMRGAKSLGAIVMAHDPSETADSYAGYTLSIGGRTQAGGGDPGADPAARTSKSGN